MIAGLKEIGRMIAVLYLCFIGCLALYTEIHCEAGIPERTFFLGCESSSASTFNLPRFCPTYQI